MRSGRRFAVPATSSAPSGAAGGELAGTYPNPTLASMLSGSGSPEGVVTATVGLLYRDTTNGKLYVKQTGTGNTGWKLVDQQSGATVPGLNLAPTAVKTGAYNAVAGDLIPVDTTAGSVTVTLPTAPADKTTIAVKHVIRGGTNIVTYACGGSDVINKTGGSTSGTLTLLAQAALLQYKASTGIWYVIADDVPLSQLDLRLASADWLVEVDVFMAAASVGTWIFEAQGSTLYGGDMGQSPIAQNNERNWDIALSAGTWDLELIFYRFGDSGIASIQLGLDGANFVQVGTIDIYGVNGANIRATITGITVATSGRYRLKLLMSTKNASSTNYNSRLEALQLRRTA